MDINIQRSLGNIGDYYAGDVKLPLDLTGNYPVLDLNEEHETEEAKMNVQQTVSNIRQYNNAADDELRLLELAGGGNNKVLDLNEEDEE